VDVEGGVNPGRSGCLVARGAEDYVEATGYPGCCGVLVGVGKGGGRNYRLAFPARNAERTR